MAEVSEEEVAAYVRDHPEVLERLRKLQIERVVVELAIRVERIERLQNEVPGKGRASRHAPPR